MNFTHSVHLTVNKYSEDFIFTHFYIIFSHFHLRRKINLPPVMGNTIQGVPLSLILSSENSCSAC